MTVWADDGTGLPGSVHPPWRRRNARVLRCATAAGQGGGSVRFHSPLKGSGPGAGSGEPTGRESVQWNLGSRRRIGGPGSPDAEMPR